MSLSLLNMFPRNGVYVLEMHSVLPSVAAAAVPEPGTAKSEAPSPNHQKELVKRCQAVIHEAGRKNVTATSFSDWLVMLRLIFAGARGGPIEGFATPVPSGTQPPGAGPILSVAGSEEGEEWKHVTTSIELMPDSYWHSKMSTIIGFSIKLKVDKLRGYVVGSLTDLDNVLLTLDGVYDDGWSIGDVTVRTLSSASPAQLVPGCRPRYLLYHCNAPRCANCCSVVPTVGFVCHCGALEYCSRECQEARAASHAPSCAAYKPYGSQRSSRAFASFNGKEFPIFWRPSGQCTYSILVDSNNPLGRAYEIEVGLLNDARRGLPVWFVNGDDPEVLDDDIIQLNFCVFDAIRIHAFEEGQIALIAAMLNYFYVWCDHLPLVERQYAWFYEACLGGEFVASHTISSLGEYVMTVRPMFEFAQVMIESALKSPIPWEFYPRLETAKRLLTAMYNVNSTVALPGQIQSIRTVLIPEQQRETLLALARIFIMMAVRRPAEEAGRVLLRAVECYRDAIHDDKAHNDYLSMARVSLQLAAVYLMFPDVQTRKKARKVRDSALQLLAKAKNSTSVSAAAVNALTALISEAPSEEEPSAPT